MKNKRNKITIGCLLICLILVSFFEVQVSATEVPNKIQETLTSQNAKAENDTVKKGAEVPIANNGTQSLPKDMEILLSSGNLDMEEANTTIPEILDTPYKKYFNFETTKVMKGIFDSSSFYFYLPDYWDLQYVYVGISYEVSRLVTGEVPASLTFLVNGVPVYSCYIEYEKGKEQILYFKIPVKQLKAGYNVLETSSYVKIYGTEGCTEDQSWSNWVNINENSYIYAGYDFVDNRNKISYYPFPFISTANPSGENTGIIVSDMASNGELAAALYLMADISMETEKENNISVSKYQDAARKGITHRILVSTTTNLPQEMRRYLQKDYNVTSSDAEVFDLSARTMVRLVEDENGNPLLLIVADKEENLMEAVHMLLDDERVSQEKNSLTFVEEGSAKLVSDSRMLSQLVAGSYTIKDIMGEGMTFIGPFHSEKILYLPFGNDYVLSSAGKITLNFRYSENLDFSRSLITVYWGDIPIASKKLTKENAASDELIFSIPSDVVGSSASSIKIAFDLEIPDLFCSMRQDQMPWAYITEDSVLYLPARENDILSFDYFPSPYQREGSFDHVMIVVSDELGDLELELLGKAIAIYGYQVSPYGNIKVIRASEFDESDADYNIITVGTMANSFLKNLNQNLHFQLNSNGDAFESNQRLVLSEQYARNIAAFQLIKSPYAASRAIFAISTTGDDTLNLAHDFLQNNSNRWNLAGDCVLVDADYDLKIFTFIEEAISESKPSLNDFVKENKQSLIFTIMAASAMVMLLTASILILTRARKYNKKEEDES